ncbi:hypothetical protein [Leptospira idonii]|uniref:Uncharacterized protein n=1 Tax=Leptospira idonii TaxID=1193500 RepID=A0A4R9M8B8_9LEPT|nr:hypothetical protein [Leptospira idonii]TGN20788.1 hypothetical protein EHS15_01765 [Leptospira idonii]
MKITNITNSIQQIHRIEGESLSLLPTETVELPETEVYDFEIERLKNQLTIIKEESVTEESPQEGEFTVRTETSDSNNEVAQ